MVSDNRSLFNTAFTVSVEARDGVTTGISAQDRAVTVLAAVKPDAQPDDLVSPGHVFPIRAKEGGGAGAHRPGPRARWTWPGWPVLSRPGLSAK